MAKHSWKVEPTIERCECADSACPVHRGKHCSKVEATVVLYRVDMADESGTAFCSACADDAGASGLYR